MTEYPYYFRALLTAALFTQPAAIIVKNSSYSEYFILLLVVLSLYQSTGTDIALQQRFFYILKYKLNIPNDVDAVCSMKLLLVLLNCKSLTITNPKNSYLSSIVGYDPTPTTSKYSFNKKRWWMMDDRYYFEQDLICQELVREGYTGTLLIFEALYRHMGHWAK